MNGADWMDGAQILPFPGDTSPAWEEKDMSSMSAAQLWAYLEELREELAAMDDEEPEDETSEEFVEWAERHEELEDLADEAVERLEALGEEVK